MDDSAVGGLTVGVMTAAVSLFGMALPPAHQLLDQAPTREAVGRVQTSCMRAAPVAIGLGAAASLFAKSPWPVIGAAIVVGWMWWQYDDAAKADPTVTAATGDRRRYA